MDKGFSLIELAMTITIIGLLLAVIAGVNSLIETGELRKVIADTNRYVLAIESYELKYGELPGDSPNAAAFFPGCATDATLGGNTCAGNGDGRVMYTDGSLREGWRAFEHLHLSGILANNLTDIGVVATSGANSIHSVIGENVPKGAISNSAYNIGKTSTTRESTYRFAVGAENSTWVADGPLFTHSQAFYIDDKIDDGFPHSGFVMSWGNATCQGDNAAITVYDLDNTNNDCSFSYQNIPAR
jgi:prepilin-type N-terminal cleavage/methylation domain-containing protein